MKLHKMADMKQSELNEIIRAMALRGLSACLILISLIFILSYIFIIGLTFLEVFFNSFVLNTMCFISIFSILILFKSFKVCVKADEDVSIWMGKLQ